jgi:hypothetical protein
MGQGVLIGDAIQRAIESDLREPYIALPLCVSVSWQWTCALFISGKPPVFYFLGFAMVSRICGEAVFQQELTKVRSSNVPGPTCSAFAGASAAD